MIHCKNKNYIVQQIFICALYIRIYANLISRDGSGRLIKFRQITITKHASNVQNS